MLLGRMLLLFAKIQDFPKITKKLFQSIIEQRWTSILDFIIYYSNQSYIYIEPI